MPPIAYTSREGLRAVLDGLGHRQRQVYDCIAGWDGAEGPSIEDIAARLDGMKESSVCGRVNELRAAGAIEDGPCKTNAGCNRAKTYRALEWRPYNPPPASAQGDFFAGTRASGTSPYSTRA